MITNYRSCPPKMLKSRGALAVSFLTCATFVSSSRRLSSSLRSPLTPLRSTLSPEEFLLTIVPKKDAYDGFNIVCGTPDNVWYYSNRLPDNKPTLLSQGKVCIIISLCINSLFLLISLSISFIRLSFLS